MKVGSSSTSHLAEYPSEMMPKRYQKSLQLSAKAVLQTALTTRVA